MYKKLRIRLTIVCTLATSLVLVGMAAVSVRFSERQFTAQSREAFSSELNALFFYLGGQSYIDHTWLSQTEANNDMLIRIEDGGAPISFTGKNPDRDRLTALALQTAREQYGFDAARPPQNSLQPETVTFRIELEGVPYRAAVCKVPVSGGWLGMTVLKSALGERAQIWRLRLTPAVFVLAAAACLLLFSWFFTARAVRPVEESRRRQSEFISAASHELRSPLAVMQASAGAMQDAPLAQAQSFAQNIEGECVRLSRLVDDLLALASADSHRWSMKWEPAEPETLLLTAGERVEALAWERGVSVEVSLPEEALPRCRCDAQRIGQLLMILLDNALEYTPDGGRIRLGARRGRRRVYLSVADSGPGIPDAQKELVFRRFYQGDRSRTHREHYGLGLSVAREIALLHKGTLSVSDAPEGGAVFTLALPV